MTGRTVAIEILVTNPRGAAVLNEFAAKSASTATQVAGHFDAATLRIGNTFTKLDQTLGSFGLPFTGALGAMGKSLAKASQDGTGFASTLSAIGGAEAVAAGAALAVVGTASVKMALDFEASHARLTQAARNVGQSLSSYSGEIEKTDSQLEKFGFTNAETEGAMSRLVAATHDVTHSAREMGLAADIARGRNLALQDATDVLTKAEQGRYLQLTRLGIISKQQAGEFHSTADAINYLTQVYGGQAQAYAETFAGKLAALKAQAVDLGVNIGEALIPKIEALVSTASTIVSGFQGANAATGGFLGQLALTAAIAPIAIAAYGKLQAGAAAIDGALSKATATMRGQTVAQAEGAASNEALAASYANLDEAQLTYLAASGAITKEQFAAAISAKTLAAAQEEVALAYASGDIVRISAALAGLTAAEDGAAVSARALATAEQTASVGLASKLVQIGAFAAIAYGALRLVGGEFEHLTTSSPNVDKLALGLQQIGQGASVSDIDVGKLRGEVRQLGDEIKRAQASGDIATVNKLTIQSDQLTAQIYTVDQLGTQFQKLAGDMKQVKEESSGIGNFIKKATLTDLVEDVIGFTSQSQKNINGFKDALKDLYQTDPGAAVTAFDRLKAALIASGRSAQEVDQQFADFEKSAGLLGSLLDPASQAQKDLNQATAKYAADLQSSHPNRDQLRTDHEAVARAAAALRGETRAAADAQNDFNDSSQRLSAAQKALKQDLDQNIGEPSKLAGDFKNLKDAVLDSTAVDKQTADALRADQAAADIATHSIITLTDAYEKLGLTQAVATAQSGANIFKGASFKSEQILTATDAQNQYNKALKDLTTNEDSSSASTKTAIAIEIEHEQKVLAVRDAQKSLADQAGKVATAEFNVAKAQYDARNAVVAVSDAQKGLIDAQNEARSTAKDLVLAERQYDEVLNGVSQSSRRAQDATENLAKARLDVRSSKLDVADADAALFKANLIGDPEGIERAQIALAEARLRNKDAINAQGDASRLLNGTLNGFSKNSKEAKDAQQQLTQAQDAAKSATDRITQAHRTLQDAFFGVITANRGVTDAQHSLRDAQDQGANAALNLKRAQADLDGQLESKSIKRAQSYSEKLDAVGKSALTAGLALGQLQKNETAAALVEIQFLEGAIKRNPALAPILLPTIGLLQDSLLPGGLSAPRPSSPSNPSERGFHGPHAGPYALGGWVPGSVGDAVTATLHAGEYVVSREELAGKPRSDSPFVALMGDDHDARAHRGSYDVGGWIPGAPGKPIDVVLHGGEYVVSRDELSGRPRADSPFFDVLHPAAHGDTRAAAAIGQATTPTASTQGFSSAGGQLIGAFADGIHERWAKSIQPFLAAARDNVTGKFHGSERWLLPHGTDIVEGFYRGLQASWPSVNAFFDVLPDQLGSKTSRAVHATAKSWQGIEGAFSLPVNWSINNVINKLVDDVNMISHAVGLGDISKHAANVPVGSFATGGIVQRDQVARVHAGEGILPAAATAKLSEGAFEALRSGDLIKTILIQMAATEKATPAPIIRGTVGGLTNTAAADVIKYLQKIPVPTPVGAAAFGPLPARGGGGGGAQLFSGPLPAGGDKRVPGHSIVQWAHDLLVAMGVPPTETDIRAMVTWANHESGGYNPSVRGGLYNPLNSTESHFGFVGQGGSQGNIKDYGSYLQGIENLAWNLTRTRGVGYEAIVSALRQGTDARAIFNAIDNSRFGTHGLREGGITNFPASGAPAILHGREAVIPLPPNFDIRELTEHRVPASAYGHRTTNVTNHIEINVETLDPYTARNLIFESLKEIEKANGYVNLKTAAG